MGKKKQGSLLSRLSRFFWDWVRPFIGGFVTGSVPTLICLSLAGLEHRAIILPGIVAGVIVGILVLLIPPLRRWFAKVTDFSIDLPDI